MDDLAVTNAANLIGVHESVVLVMQKSCVERVFSRSRLGNSW